MNHVKTLINVSSNEWLPHSNLFTNQHVRGFISESGVIFNFVQRVSHDQELLNHVELTKSSRQYRSVIHSWFIKILDFIPDQTETLTLQEQNELDDLAKILHKMEIAWHLCEILYIDIRSTGTLLVQLLNWVKWHFTYYVELAEQVIVSELPQMHEYYWDVIMFFALRGDMENASLFLELHSESKIDPAFILIRDLLKKFPVLTNNQVIHEYYLRWQLWHESVIDAINNGKISSSNKKSNIQLKLLLHLLAGDIEAFKQVTFLFQSWYQMMVSYLLFTDQCLKGSRLDTLSDDFIHIYYTCSRNDNYEIEVDAFDELIRSAFNYELMDVIKRASLCFNDNWWFVTHFVDLIFNSNQFNDYQIADIGQIRDAFVTDYANSLLSRPKNFWQLSIEYLLHCKNSQDHILLSLEHIPFNSESELQKLLALARRFNYVDLEQSLCRIQARRWLRHTGIAKTQKLSSGLFWAIRSKDKMLINYIVDQYLRHYLITAAEAATKSEKTTSDGELLDNGVISNIGGAIVLSERLIFLCKYHEFHQLRNSGQYSSAAKILVDMLASNAIPEFFTFQVILDCLPLLESDEVVIGGEQTCKILASLEQILARLKDDNQDVAPFWLETKSTITTANNSSSTDTNSQDEIDQIKTYQRNMMNKYEKMLRLAISRNISRNFVLPTSSEFDLLSIAS